LIIDTLRELFSNDNIKEIELICCDKDGPCLRTADKLVDIKGYIDPENKERYSTIILTFEHFTWTFHHKMAIEGIAKISDNEYRINYTNPWICGQFLIRVYRG
jgi:hypothetical protein